jgi:phage tail sheath gpL-like
VGPGEKVQVVRAISSYIKNPEGVDDESLLDITSITTMDYTRESINTRLALRFPASKLSDRTPAKVQVEIEDVLLQLDDQEILENVEEHMDKVKVERNAGDKNRLDWSIPNDVVNGLHIIAGRMDMYL